MLEKVTVPQEDAPSGWSCVGQPAFVPRDRILNAATELFCMNGFSATGIDAVVSHSGAAKSTLYAHFKSKDDLIEAVLEREGAAWRGWFFGRLAEVSGTPREKLAAVFDVLEEWFADPHFYGCPFINAIAEAPQSDDTIRRAAQRHKSHLLTWLTAQAIELRHAEPEEMARRMVVLIDGAIVAAQSSRDPSFARSAKAMIDSL